LFRRSLQAPAGDTYNKTFMYPSEKFAGWAHRITKRGLIALVVAVKLSVVVIARHAGGERRLVAKLHERNRDPDLGRYCRVTHGDVRRRGESTHDLEPGELLS
jgi:hypothetical protein